MVFRGRARHGAVTGSAQPGSRGPHEPARQRGRQLALALYRGNVVRAGLRSLARLDHIVEPSFMKVEKNNPKMAEGAVQLAPSILAADFTRLGEQVAQAEQAGADRIHVDVLDGHFVPNISFGAPIIQSLRRVTRLPLETHLMISDPDFFLDEFVEAGSDSFLIHWEGNNNLHRTIQRIKGLGKRAGVAINPATPAAMLEEILPDLDQVLVMTVNPGFGHQYFLKSTLPKIRRVSQMIEQTNPGCALEVDGGIDETTALLAVEAGANVLVAGTAIFGTNKKVADAIEGLRDAVTVS